MKKILSLILTFCMLVGLSLSFASCGDNGGEGGSKKEADDKDAWYADLDFSGTTLTISQSINKRGSNVSADNALDNSEKYTRGPSAMVSDTVQNLCFKRNKDAREYLGLTIKYVETNLGYDEIQSYVEQCAALSNAPYDLLINDVYAIPYMILNGYLYNVKSQDTKNYFNFEDDSWYHDYMDGLTLDTNKQYALAGDYFIDIIRNAHCLYLNTALYETYCAKAYDMSLEDLYEVIDADEWTYEIFQDLIELGWITEGTGATASIDDTSIGFLDDPSFGGMPFCYGSGISMMKKTADGYGIETNTTTLTDFCTYLHNLLTAPGVLYVSTASIGGNMRKPFTDGKVLFLGGYWLGDLEYDTFMGMENKTPLVYPKYSNDIEGYRTYVHDSAELGSVLKTVAQFPALSAYVQILNEKSVDIMNQYYEFALKYKYGTQVSTLALTMMDRIHNTICSPFEQATGRACIATLSSEGVGCDIYTLGESMYRYEAANAVKTFNENLYAYQEAMKKVVEKFKTID